MNSPRLMTIMFADVAGSVDLYSELGDDVAHQRIREFQQLLSGLIKQSHGRIIEVIGDEVMCAFDQADNAFAAVRCIQETLDRERKHGLNVRIGLHSGITSEHDSHPFGDTVNVAARIVALAKAGQIMLTDQTWQYLNAENRLNTCVFNKVSIKGKREPYTVHQAVRNQEDRTILVDHDPVHAGEQRHRITSVLLQSGDRKTSIANGSETLIGRGDQCQMRIDSEFASRVHAIIKCQGGKLVLEDRSANGTYIKTLPGHRLSDSCSLFLHQEEWTTTCNGIISLGEPFPGNTSRLVRFNCS